MTQHCPEHRPECSHGKSDIKRSQVSSELPAGPTGSATGNIWNSGDGLQCTHGRENSAKLLYKFLAWSSSNYLRFRFITALLTLPDFCLLFLSVPSPCFLILLNVCLLSSTCLLPNTFRFVFNTLLMAVIRFHPKDFLQY